MSEGKRNSVDGKGSSRHSTSSSVSPLRNRKSGSKQDHENFKSKSSHLSGRRLSTSSHSTSHSDQEEKKNTNTSNPTSQKELKEFHAKTIDRIIHKRREYDAKFLQYTDERRKESNAFRMHWKENLKRQRLEAIISEVDRKIVQTSIPTKNLDQPNTYSYETHLSNILKLRKENEKELHRLTADLDDIDDIIPFEKRKDSGVYTLSLKQRTTSSDNANANKSAPSSRPVSITGGRMRSASIEFNSGRKYSVGSKFLQYICSFNLNVRSKLLEPWSGVSSVKLRFDINSEKDSKKMTNQLQIMELLDDIIVKDPRLTAATSTTPFQPNNNIKFGGSIPIPPTQKRLPKGLMLQVFQEILENYPGSSSLNMGRKISHSISIDDSVTYTKSPLFPNNAAKDAKNENPQLSSLVDGCFLIGPDQSSIIQVMMERGNNSNPVGTALSPEVSSQKEKVPSTQSRHVVTPKVLFRSEFHFPPEMLQLLPSYCFPSDAEVILDTANMTKNRQSLNRKDSINRFDGSATSEIARRTLSAANSKRTRVFFPSNETIRVEDDEVVKENLSSPPIGMIPTRSTLSSVFKAPFIILLGDHTYQQYCLVFQIPVVFFDSEKGFMVQTNYCLCFLTKFAFFTFLTHMIQQIDEELKIFSFKEALPEFDPKFPAALQLRLLNDLTNKLKKIMVPLYPYLVRNDSSLPLSASKVNSEAAKKSSDNHSGASNPSAAGSNNHQSLMNLNPAPTAQVNNEYLAILQDLQFSFHLNVNNGPSYIGSPASPISPSSAHSERKQFNFIRTFYQNYYSQYLSPSDVSLDSNLIHLYEKNYQQQGGKLSDQASTLGRNHLSEKDREDSFFILQWALPTLLKYLPLDQIVLALGCAMTEMVILVKHKDLQVVSSVILAMAQLLKPLKWCSPIIITLPDQLQDLIESPVPIILGLQKLPPGFALPERYVVVDPQERIVHLNPFDLVQSQSILLPNGSRLVTALKSCADAILRFSSRAKKARVKPVTISPIRMDKNSPTPALSPFSVNNHSPVKPFDNLGVDHHRASDIHTTIGATSTSLSAAAVKTESTIQEVKDEIKNSSPNPPSYPLELDCKNSDCTSYLGYIKQFVTIVHNHILAILNTAIHLQHVEKQAAKAKRRVVANKPLETLKSKGVDHTTEHVNTERGGNFDKLKTSPNPKTVNEHHLMHTDSLDVGVGSFDQLENLNGKKPPKDPKSANNSPQKLPQSSMPTQKYLSPQKDEKRDIDEYSDVTLTDFPVEENDPSNESFCSSSSSLPSLASDAPLLAVKEIGQNGLKFVKQLADTQMFSNYCQSLKLHSSTTTVDGSIIGANTVVAGVAPTGDKQGLSGVESDHHVYQTPHHHDLRFDEAILDEEDNFDSISSLFDILLTGTVPLDAKAIQPYQIIYDSLYSAQPKVNVDLATYEREWFSKISRLLKNRERLARYRKKLIKSIALSSNSYTFSVAANNHPLNYLYESGDNQMGGLADGLIPDLKQCNGLICNGFCNTAICSEICIELWTAKVKKLRHHQAAYEIVSKKYEKKSKAPVYTRVNPSYLESNSDQFQQLKRMTLESTFSSGIVGGSMLPENERTPPKIEYLTKDGPHYEIFRHQRETESQYRQRKEITRESILKKQGSGTAYTSLEGVQHNRSTRSHRSSPREGDARKRKKDKRRRHRANSSPSKTFTAVSFFKVNSINHLPSSAIKASAQLSALAAAASSENGAEKKRFSAKDMFLKKRKFIAEDSSSSNFLHTSHDSNHNYLTALAKYYAKREERLVHKYLKRCKRRIQQFLLNFIYTYRRKRFLLAVIIVQAYLRRFHVRLHLEEILDKIHEERQQRFCSKVRIRNFLRYYGDFIMRNRHRKQLLEQRKRLSRVSIPIAAPKDASDVTKGKILSANSNLSNMGQPVKYINDPTLPTMSSNTMDTNEKISRSMKDDTVGKARLQQKKELNINTSEVGEAAFVVPNTKKNASLGNGATPQAANTPTYTDRAKEFLQFGKILRRSSLPTPRLLPMRRKSNDFKKPTVGVAIPSTDDHSTSTGELNHDGDAPSAIHLTQINDNLKVTEKRSPASKGEAALSPTADPSLSPTQRALHVDYFQADAVPNRGPPLPARKSLDQAGILNILEHSNSHSNSAKVGRSKSSELERTNSQETADDLSTHSSSLVRSFGNEANQSNSNSDMEPSNSAMSHPQHRNSFFSRGLSSLLTRSRSTDSNQSERLAMKRNTIATASPLSSLNHSPSLALHSSQSYEFDDFGNPMIATGSVKSGSSPASEEREKDKEKKRFSDIFERSDGNTPTLSFPNVFGFSGGNGSDDGKSPSRKGGVSGYDSVEVANKTDSSRSRTQSEELNGKLPPNGGMDGSNHSSQSHSQSVSSKGSSKNGGNYGFVKAVRAAATSFLTTQSDDHEEKALEKNVPEEKRKASLADEGAEYLNNLIDEDDDGYGHLSDDLASEFDSFPLKSLGPTAMEYINRQQITLIKKMWKHLLQGVPVIKHSRSGKPKNKILFCDYAMTRLYWRSPGSKPDPHLAVVPSIDEDIRRVPSDYLMIHEGPDDVGGRHSEETITHGSDSDLLASSHSHFTLQNSHSNYSLLGLGGAKVGKRKSIFSSHPFQDSFRRSSFTKSDREREITLKEILSITSDGQSDVFRRSAAKNYFQQHEDTSLMTLFLLHRSLDCEIVTDIFAEIFPALQIIVNYFQIYMTGHLSLRSDVQEQLTYVLKNGEHFPQHAYHHHHLNNNNQQQQFIKDGMNEHEDEMNDVLGKYRNQGHPMAPPPNTPNIANNYQYPNRYMTSGTNSNINVIGNVQGHQHRNNDDGHHRNSLKHLFPIAENQEEEK